MEDRILKVGAANVGRFSGRWRRGLVLALLEVRETTRDWSAGFARRVDQARAACRSAEDRLEGWEARGIAIVEEASRRAAVVSARLAESFQRWSVEGKRALEASRRAWAATRRDASELASDGVFLASATLDAGPLGPPIEGAIDLVADWLTDLRREFGRRVRPTGRWRSQLELEMLEIRELMAGAISGVVFQDFNANGVRDLNTSVTNSSGTGSVSLAIDRGLGGVLVRAFDATNTVQGSAVTAADGTFSFTPKGTGPFRVEYTSLPAGYAPGPFGVDSAGPVRFVPDSGLTSANLGLVLPSEYVQDNPLLVTTCYVYGDQINGPNAASPVLVSFPYAAGSNSPTGATSYTVPTTHELAVPANKIGTTWGVGYDPGTRFTYASAYMRKHAGYGPDGTGAIYRIDRSGNVTLFSDLNAIFGPLTAGPNAHDTSDYDTDNGNVAWDAVGKTSLGGLDLSPDGATLYVMNLADRRLYAIPTQGTIDATTVRSTSIPLNIPGATGAGGADLRPFAVQWYDGKLYVGIVNSAESTQLASDLRAYVYEVDPATLQFGASPIYQMALDYPRATPANSGSPASANWNPWSPTFRNANPGGTFGFYPQPMLSGLAFDPDGNLVLAFRDRFGDQTGSYNLSNPANPSQRVDGVAGGDTLRLFINTPGDLAGGWTLENNARGPAGQGNGPQNNGQGPGNAEFYYQDNHTTAHLEVTIGAAAQIPGTPDIMVNAYDPGLSLRTGGPIWLNNQAGSKTKAYQLYSAPNTGQPDVTFGKSNGLGDLVVLAEPGPIQLGDRVFRDLNSNGIQDPGEPGIGGVTVRLYQGAGLVGTTTTDSTGQYLFGASNVTGGIRPTTPYQIRLDNAADYAAGGPLRGLSPTLTGASAIAGSKAVLVNGFPTISFSTAGAGVSDFTLDAGFVQGPTSQVCGVVFVDQNGDGIYQPGEPTVKGASVLLTGTNDLNDPVTSTIVTGADGTYCFTGLRSGTYAVTRDLPRGYEDPLVGPTSYNPVVVTAGTDVLNDNFPVQQSQFSGLSGYVYFDLNHNGVMDDATDFGIAGVTVTLTGTTDAGDLVDMATQTDDDGFYAFDDLLPGTYTLTETQPRYFHDYIDNIGTQGGTVGDDEFSNIVLPASTFGEQNNFGELQQPDCNLRHLAIAVGQRMANMTALRDADPDGFDSRHPYLGPVLAAGEVPRGIGGFPLGPLAYQLVPKLGTKVIPLIHGVPVGSNPVPIHQPTGEVPPAETAAAPLVAAQESRPDAGSAMAEASSPVEGSVAPSPPTPFLILGQETPQPQGWGAPVAPSRKRRLRDASPSRS